MSTLKKEGLCKIMTARKALYVGGIDQNVTQEVLHAAFVPFGELRDVHIPMDYRDNTNKGFGFVEFVDENDADAAIDNMDGAELCGKILRVNATKGIKKSGGPGGKQALWDMEEHLQESQALFASDGLDHDTIPAIDALDPDN